MFAVITLKKKPKKGQNVVRQGQYIFIAQLQVDESTSIWPQEFFLDLGKHDVQVVPR